MLTKIDLAKYPFTAEAAEYVKGLGIEIDELASDEYSPILERAEKRIEESIVEAKVSGEMQDVEVEIPSFPTAIMLVSQLRDERVARRYALAESKRANEILRNEVPEKILDIASNTFRWKIKPVSLTVGGDYYDYAIHFKDYLRNAVNIRESKWKLTNRILEKGYTYVTRDEASRLLEEEVQRKVLEKTLQTKVELPSQLEQRVGRIRQLAAAKMGFREAEELPKIVSAEAMPPCIKNLYDALFAGTHISHVGRFTLTSFLINIGATEQDLINLFKEITDFDEGKTRYQIEHIAGRRGTRTKYVPPKCDTLRTHGICVKPDELCKSVRHPLTYYRRKLRTILRKRK